MANGDILLQHNAEVYVVRDETGERFGPFRTKSGGGKTGENQLIRPGGMAPPIAVAGTYGFEEVTCAKILKHEQDSGLVAKFYGWHGERFTVQHQALDSKGRPGFHNVDSYGGRLNTSTPPEYDVDGNDPATLELVFTMDGLS